MSMRVSQRLDYALQALVLLASRPLGTSVAAGDLARELNLPKRFVEQQVTTLSHANIVTCRRGATGGCALARPASEVTVDEVVIALHGTILDIPRQSDSATAELWDSGARALGDFLRGVTLADLAKRQQEMATGAEPIYYI